MRLSQNGRTLIQSFEGLSLNAYPDAHGYSIGFGHFLGTDPSHRHESITREEANRLFDQDVAKFEAAVSLKTPRAEQHQFDAMVSLAYNVGAGGFADSTVARLHNQGDVQGAADAFRMWNKSQGKVHEGLVKRRERERGIYLHGYTEPGHYPTPLPPQSPVTPPTWPPRATAPSTPTEPSWSTLPGSTYKGASIASLVTLAIGWLVYRLVNR